MYAPTIAKSRSLRHRWCDTIFVEPLQFGGGAFVIADRLAAYAQSLRYEDLPADVVHEVKRRVLDSLACTFGAWTDRKSTRLNSSHLVISYAVFCLKKKKKTYIRHYVQTQCYTL